MSTRLCFIDTETTGLDPDIHNAYEVCWWLEGAEPQTAILPHTLVGADDKALEIGGYHRRGIKPGGRHERKAARRRLRSDLDGVTLVGSNPAFDAAFLRKTLDCQPWHHRLINVAEGGMWVFGWDRPKGLADVANVLRHRGHVIPDPDHTAAGDVAATRAVYYALRDERSRELSRTLAPSTAPLSDVQPSADHPDVSGAGGATEGEGGK